MEEKMSFFRATVTLSRLCLGPGVLAIPAAFAAGGFALSPVGLIAIAVWNGFSCVMMIRCKHALMALKLKPNWHVPDGVLLLSTYSEVAYAGLGKYGVYLADFSVIGSLLGVCCACQINFATLLHDLQFIHNFSISTLIFISAIIVYPISCAKDLSALSSIQFIGLICILCNVAAFLIYGYILYYNQPLDQYYTLAMLPESTSDVFSYFGVVCFCYGVCTFIFPIEENMENNKDFNRALLYSLVLVSLFYIIVGEAASFLYSEITQGHISGNILLNLPNDSIATTVARLSMAGVCLLTYPLTILPPVTMTENFIDYYYTKVSNMSTYSSTSVPSVTTKGSNLVSSKDITLGFQRTYSTLGDDAFLGVMHEREPEIAVSLKQEEDLNKLNYSKQVPSSVPLSWHMKTVIRLLFCLFTTTCAVYIPCFSFVVSLLGCFTIAILSFFLPPLLHLTLVSWPALSIQQNLIDLSATKDQKFPSSLSSISYAAISENGFEDSAKQEFIPKDCNNGQYSSYQNNSKNMSYSNMSEIGFADSAKYIIPNNVHANHNYTSSTAYSPLKNKSFADVSEVGFMDDEDENDNAAKMHLNGYYSPSDEANKILIPKSIFYHSMQCLLDVTLALVGLFITITGTIMTFSNITASYQQC